VAVGLTGALGIAFGGETMKLFIEAEVVSLRWAPSSSEVTGYSVNGVDKLSTLSVEQRKTNFDNSTFSDSRTPSNGSVESTSVKSYFPFSNLGLKAGFMFGF
jgi:hypothetical protein